MSGSALLFDVEASPVSRVNPNNPLVVTGCVGSWLSGGPQPGPTLTVGGPAVGRVIADRIEHLDRGMRVDQWAPAIAPLTLTILIVHIHDESRQQELEPNDERKND